MVLLAHSLTYVEGLEQRVKLSTPFPSVELKVAQQSIFKIKIQNVGADEDSFNLTVLSPLGWETSLKSGALVIKSVYLEAGENRELDLEIIPPAGEKSGVYAFTINAFSKDGVLQDSLSMKVGLPLAVVQSGIIISSLLPSIEAASGESVEFRLNVINKNTYDELIFFTASYPQGWVMTFTPSYETVAIRSLEFAPSENQVIVAKITSPAGATPGTYKIDVVAQAEEFKETVSLTVFIIGKYSVTLSPTNSMVSFDAEQGKPTPFSFYVNNTGTAPLKDISIFSDKPDGWDVKFDTTTISTISAKSVQEVRAVITPLQDAIPGDYVVIIYCSNYNLGLSFNLNYRVTVKGSIAWGYLGIGIIVILIGVVFLIYRRLGRR